MDAEEYANSKGYTKDDGYGWIITQSELIDLLNEFSEHQNKALIEELEFFANNKNTIDDEYDLGYNQALENLRDILTKETGRSSRTKG